MKILSVLFCMLAFGCGSSSTTKPATRPPANNKWSDARLVAVLEAQDHRDSKALLVLLRDTSAVVREAAAMAFSSVQDSSARDGLIAAMHDKAPAVRRAAMWALSFVADSTALKAIDVVVLERADTTTAISNYVALSRMLRGAKDEVDIKDQIEALYLRKTKGYFRKCSAQAISRMPKEKLIPEVSRYVGLVQSEKDPEVKMLLLAGMKNFSDTLAKNTVMELLHDPDPKIRVAALRAHAIIVGNAAAPELLQAVNDSFPGVRSTAVELLQGLTALDGEACWAAGQEYGDVMVKIPLYGLAVKFGDEGTRNVAASLMQSMWTQGADPYVRAALIDARAATVGADTLVAWFQSPRPAVERQATFAAAIKLARIKEEQRGSATNTSDRLKAIFRAALETGDAGLVAAVADELLKENVHVIATVLDTATEARARALLHPIRDFETLQILGQVVAKRDGLPTPPHQGPSFNHPIDRTRLATLQEGKQYRITTTKGEIVIAIEPNAAPGTCVAFDSLVTAGFYNGKYFHRVVPDFVAQGGCPRGDGYGAMDWTMRTEIGYDGFDTGAVGVASAGRDTESCQFFITLAPAPHLDGRYTRFAHVVSGMDVAQQLVVGDQMARVERVE